MVAHPDDEVLGCGATIAKHVAEGDEVSVKFLTDGVSARGESQGEEAKKRRTMAENAASILGIHSLRFADFPDNKMDSAPLLDIVKEVEREIVESKPQRIYTHHGADLNVDHRLVYQALMTACRPLPGSSVNKIYSMEVASSTEWSAASQAERFSPNYFNDVSQFLDKKFKALDAYAKEMREFPHPRSIKAIEALARWRGATAGMLAAESFFLERELDF